MTAAFLTIQEAADLYKLSRQSIWRKAKSGGIPSTIDPVSGVMKVQLSDLIAHYGEPDSPKTWQRKRNKVNETFDNVASPTLTTLHQSELQHLRERLAEAQERIQELKETKRALEADKERLFSMVERQQLLLQGLSSKATKKTASATTKTSKSAAIQPGTATKASANKSQTAPAKKQPSKAALPTKAVNKKKTGQG